MQVRGWDPQTCWSLQKAVVFSGKQEFGEDFGGLDTWPKRGTDSLRTGVNPIPRGYR